MFNKKWNLLIDFDGTLHDTESVFSSKLDGLLGLNGKTLYHIYLFEIHRKLVHEFFPKRHNDMIFHWELLCKHLKIPIEKKLIRLLDDRFKEADESTFENPKFFKDAKEFLDLATLAGHRLCLSSGGGNSEAKAESIEKFFGENYFKDVIGEKTLNHLKDDPSYYKEALKRLSWDSQEVVSIGDSIVTDIYPAKLVGIKTVWVNRKKENEKELNRDKTPDYIVTNLLEAIDYLKSTSI